MVFCNEEDLDVFIYECRVTILILIDGFLQSKMWRGVPIIEFVTILILIDGFLQSNNDYTDVDYVIVTILILIDGFLQFRCDSYFCESR